MPTCDEEMDAAQHDAGISGSWAGGADGMQVTDALLRQVDVGVLFFLVLGSYLSVTHTPVMKSIGIAVTPRTILPGRSEAK